MSIKEAYFSSVNSYFKCLKSKKCIKIIFDYTQGVFDIQFIYWICKFSSFIFNKSSSTFFWKVEAFNFHFYMLHVDNLKREDYKNQSRDKLKKMHNIKTVLKFWNTKETNYMLVN